MPLMDHFHPPLLGRRHWEGLHGLWAAVISTDLNERLPREYFSEMQVTLSSRVEVDVATLSERDLPDEPAAGGNGVATAVETKLWAPPEPAAVMPAVFPDDMEVLVFDSSAGPTLVGAIELVSPGNKDRDDTRRAFAAKCAAYLQRGVGLMIVDVVTARHFNLHDELVALLGHGNGFCFEMPTHLYVTAYRPARRQERNEIDLWRETLTLGQPLPTLPLAVRGLGCLAIDLERTYAEACRRGRIG